MAQGYPHQSFEQGFALLDALLDTASTPGQTEASTSALIQASPGITVHVKESLRTLSPPRVGQKFKGIRRRKWGKVVSEIRGAQGKRIWLGSYSTEEEAARVYDEAARILQGPRAWLNFPQDPPGTVALSGATVKTLEEHRELMQLKKKGSPRLCLLRASASSSSDDSTSNPCNANSQLPAIADVSTVGEWESLLTSLQDPSPSLWMKGVGPISPESSVDQSGAGHVELIPELSLDFDADFSSGVLASPLHSCSSDSSGAPSPVGDCIEDLLDLPPLSFEVSSFLFETEGLVF